MTRPTPTAAAKADTLPAFAEPPPSPPTTRTDWLYRASWWGVAACASLGVLAMAAASAIDQLAIGILVLAVPVVGPLAGRTVGAVAWGVRQRRIRRQLLAGCAVGVVRFLDEYRSGRWGTWRQPGRPA